MLSYICALNILSHWNLIIRTKGYLKVFSKGFSDYFIAHVIVFQNHNSIESINAHVPLRSLWCHDAVYHIQHRLVRL
jgi:hypothetical protein